MRFAVPVGEDGARFDHFGFCDHFVIVEVSEGAGEKRAAVCGELGNPVKGPKGCASRAAAFQEAGIEAVVADHVGAPMYKELTAVGIPVMIDAAFLEPEEAARKAYDGELAQMTEADI